MGDRQLYTVDQVAELLGLHPKTVRGYIRDGRLKATRLGSRYRIASEEVEAFTGRSASPPAGDDVRRSPRTQVSATVHLDAVSPDAVHRIDVLLGAAVAHHEGGEGALQVHTAYDEVRASARIVLLGGPSRVAGALQVLAMVTEEGS
ncbi:helix-turn-helix domain-containing protein [Streptomyces sp. 549]|uniref:helix-turn-helix domain-containing protein n=1 Tax=Streptomyces sp. 549 TaxID=3049076 RepID=UPI0024C3C382|nr:helix-turn-helix domain-containing protein [Streptomyces sp. 549]MDK1472978.1 helix-turn-helix domain-containing protein [Streptomyces sp. 549]